MRYFGTMKVVDNELEVGGVSVSKLKEDYGTPLYIMDETYLRDRCRVFKEGFQSDRLKTEVIYASKAFLTLAMAKLVAEEGLSIDVVSGGELYTVLKAGFPAENIYFHGNNKSKWELEMAVEAGIGTVVIDNKGEIGLLEEVLAEKEKTQKVLLRVNPGIDAHTHAYIQTTKNDSKFGESIFDEAIFDVIATISNSDALIFDGLHCHIGSQIFEEQSFIDEAKAMVDFSSQVYEKTGSATHKLNLGGGFGVYYVEGDKPFDYVVVLKRILDKIADHYEAKGMEKGEILIEPGRAIVSNAGSTMYEIGGVKETYGGKRYLFVDGGMTDNIRPALYQAEYEAVIANKPTQVEDTLYTVAGKCCESGDVIIKDITLAEAEVGDLLVVSTTGAYNYTMSMNYNRLLKPAVVFVADGRSRLVVRRETLDDLIRNDLLD